MSYSLSMSLFGLFPIADDIPFSAVVKRTFMLLPEDEDYLPRLADPRVGTLWSDKVSFSDKAQGSEVQYWVNRWNLTEENSIVFYVDTLLQVKPYCGSEPARERPSRAGSLPQIQFFL